jgi:hypothetical protein
MKTKPETETWVLTRVIDETDPLWDERATIVGSPEQINAMFDLSDGVPFGWRLLKGKQATRWIEHSLREELRYQRDKALREKADGNC